MTIQRRLISSPRVAQWALVGALGFAASAAHADPPACSSLSNVVYVGGSTAQQVFIGAVAGALGQLTPPVHVVYSPLGSCVGVATMASTSPTALNGHGVTFTAAGADDTVGCSFDIAGTPADVGASDVWADSCLPAITVASDVKDFHGPVQAMNFIIPKPTTGSPPQLGITHDAAHLVFGDGVPANGNNTSWTDPTLFHVRGSTSGTMIMAGAAIGVPATQWWGVVESSGGKVIGNIGTDPGAIGLAASGNTDTARGTIIQLAYQHTGQTKGYTPDSDSQNGSFDKANVRDGHYMIWGPAHLLAHTGAGGVPTNANAKVLLDALAGIGAPLAGLDLIKIEAKNGVVPDCAMRVSREKDGGDMSCYFPPEGSCTCKFLTEATGAKPANCTTCATDGDCKSVTTPDGSYDQGVCKNIINGSGFCEVK